MRTALITLPLITLLGCEPTDSSDKGCDTSFNGICPGDDADTDADTDDGETLPDEMDVVPSPTDKTLNPSGGDFKGMFCMVDRLDPRLGLELVDQCDGNNLILGFTVLENDRDIVYGALSGVYTLVSSSEGEMGHGPVRGSTALRLDPDATTEMVMRSVVLGQDTYTLQFTMDLTKEGPGNFKISIPTVNVSRDE